MNRRSDDFVARLVKDPADPPALTLLRGYPGASPEEGYVRLYLDVELSRYVEIPREAVRHARGLTPAQSPLGGSLVWVDRPADLMHGRAGEKPGAESFFKGWVEDEYGEVTAAFGGGRRGGRA